MKIGLTMLKKIYSPIQRIALYRVAKKLSITKKYLLAILKKCL
ncbi:hypothetical protein LSO9J_80033 [Candidatus Liberibacter solanacearum]